MNTCTLIICVLCIIRPALAMEAASDGDSGQADTNCAASVLIPLPAPDQPPNVVPLSTRGATRQGHFLRQHPFQAGRLLVRHLPQSAIGFYRAKFGVEPRGRAGAGRDSRAFRPAQSATHSLCHVQSARTVFIRSGRRNLRGRNFLGWPHTGHRHAGANAVSGSKRNGQHASRPLSAARRRFFAARGRKLQDRPYARLFETVFGRDVFKTSTDEQIYDLTTAAIAVYEASAEINQFSSKYDASTNGTPPMHLYTFTRVRGKRPAAVLRQGPVFPNVIPPPSLTPVLQATQGKETFTMYCYANIGVPKIPEIRFTPTPTAIPTRKAATRSALISLTTVSAPTRIPRPMARCSWTPNPATSPIRWIVQGPQPAQCGPASVSGLREDPICTTACSKVWKRSCIFTTNATSRPIAGAGDGVRFGGRPARRLHADFPAAGKHGIPRQCPKYRRVDPRRIRRPDISRRRRRSAAGIEID